MNDGPALTKRERLAEIFRRLELAPCSQTAEEMYQLLCRTITAVEDEMTTIPNDPPKPPIDDGRIYPPQDDQKKFVKNRPDLRRYVSRAHNTLIRDNGALTILDHKKVVVFDKVGSDGEGTG